jgi:hypothetical protein
LPEFGISKNIKQVGRTDLPGGGLVTVENGHAYVGHIDPPYGTSIVDVHDPKHPKLVSQLEVPEGIHSDKVRVSGDVMLVNYERFKTKKDPQAGLKIFDISDKFKPREIAFFKTAGKGVHRFTFDGRHQPAEQVYGNTLYVTWFSGGLRALDISNPYSPKEVGHYVPQPGKGQKTVKSNDVFRSDKGLLYLTDRYDGLEILESQV